MYPDIYNDLINTPSVCTHEQLKAYKVRMDITFSVVVVLVI